MADESHSTPYDSFAWFYNRYWGASWAERVQPILEKLALSAIPSQARILDLCCGTGHIAAILAARGYRVTGADYSTAMLDFARKNAPEVEFVHADARRVHLPPHFDLAISLYDSLNHILNYDDLVSVFSNVRRALKPNGLFVFDLNSEAAYIANWKQAWPLVGEDHLLAMQPSFDRTTKTARMVATMFQLINDQWVRSTSTFEQHCYSENEVCEALAKAGFDDIEIHSADNEFGGTGSGRLFFTTKRPRV